MMKKIIKLFFLVLILFSVSSKDKVLAHQPNYLGNKTEVTITDPEISRAFYGELNSQPIKFNIFSEKEFDLYVNLLSPDIENAKTNFKLEIFDNQNKIIGTISDGEWKKYWEEFARDSYLKGPEFEKNYQEEIIC